MILDAWAQHPTQRLPADPIFEPLVRWTRRMLPTTEPPVEATVAAMDEAGLRRGHPRLFLAGNACRVYALEEPG